MVPEGFNELVRRSRAGDPEAVERLLTLIQPWLDGLAQPWPDAPDLAQEAWLRSWQHLDQFQGGDDDQRTRELFRAWLRRIVDRLGLNTLRSRLASRRHPPGTLQSLDRTADVAGQAVEPIAREPSPAARAEQGERHRLVRSALERLPDETERAIVQMRFLEGLSLRKIAQRLGQNPEQVRQRFHAALRRLEHDLKGLS